MSDTEPSLEPNRSVRGVIGHTPPFATNTAASPPPPPHTPAPPPPPRARRDADAAVPPPDDARDHEPQDRGELAREDDAVDRLEREDDPRVPGCHHIRSWLV